MTGRAPAPTDLDLMRYADDELEGDELAAMEAHLARDEAARRKVAALRLGSTLVAEEARAGAAAADGIADRVMGAIAAEAKPAAARAVPVMPPPANDNTRRLTVLAALAVAAAAGLLLWARGPSAPRGTGLPVVAVTTPAPGSEAADGEADVEHGVEVAAVDFGAGTGAVFYVPAEAATTTTVVWLSDDASGGDE
jgi:anti-sigma factor RsiW